MDVISLIGKRAILLGHQTGEQCSQNHGLLQEYLIQQ
jgi:hypothetical protein